MSKLNIKPQTQKVSNLVGLQVPKIKDPHQQLMRLVLANMLFEDQFYIDGQSSANLIENTVKQCDPNYVSELALEARTHFNLRHVPLYLLSILAKAGSLKKEALVSVIQRPDEITEFLAMYWKAGKCPISNQVKRGLAQALLKFNEYQLAKWDSNSSKIRLRDVLFLTHAKPQNKEQADLFAKLAENKLATPDTWETKLSSGADKGEVFAELLTNKKLGALAFIRNLRNMLECGIPTNMLQNYASSLNVERVLPFRYIAAYRQVPQLQKLLNELMLKSLSGMSKLPGRTVLLVDVSGSMFGTKVSKKSDLDRFDAAAALAILAQQLCEDVQIFTFSNYVVPIRNFTQGLDLPAVLQRSQPNSGTDIRNAVVEINRYVDYDRLIIFTDEQSQSHIPNPKTNKSWIINVGSYENGISNNGQYKTITGFSERVFDYIRAVEVSNM